MERWLLLLLGFLVGYALGNEAIRAAIFNRGKKDKHKEVVK